MATKRKSISDDVKLRLWAVSGARCGFPGCNRPLWRDKLTLSGANFSEMAHIVAVNPGGARYSEEESAKLATDIENLILLCRDHHTLVDSREHRAEHPQERLLQMKRAHEERIFSQTSIAPELRTRVLVLVATIGDRRPEVASDAVFGAALYPRYPADTKGMRLEFVNLNEPKSPEDWARLAKQVEDELLRQLAPGNERDRVEHISVFALSPIPILMHFGKVLGNTRPTELYQLHRDEKIWHWGEDVENDLAYSYTWPDERDAKDIALVLSISGKPAEAEVRAIVGADMPIYEIAAPEPSPLFMQTRARLSAFRELYRRTLSEIRTRHGGSVNIHLFPALPVSAAVACGQDLLPKADPPIVVYDHHRSGGWVRTLQIN